jgi:hypothetical protein
VLRQHHRLLGGKRRRRAASCCIVLVMYGGYGLRRFSLLSTSATLPGGAGERGHDRIGLRLVLQIELVALPGAQLGIERLALGRQLGGDRPEFSGTKARISRSRSQMSRSATDCTRPADNP